MSDLKEYRKKCHYKPEYYDEYHDSVYLRSNPKSISNDEYKPLYFESKATNNIYNVRNMINKTNNIDIQYRRKKYQDDIVRNMRSKIVLHVFVICFAYYVNPLLGMFFYTIIINDDGNSST